MDIHAEPSCMRTKPVTYKEAKIKMEKAKALIEKIEKRIKHYNEGMITAEEVIDNVLCILANEENSK